MSGIAGIVYHNAFQIGNLLSPMLETLSHRGNGEKKQLSVRNIQIGCCGTSLLSNSKRTVTGSIDGFLTNHQELKKQLLNAGFDFKTEDATEIIIYAYEYWGVDFLKHLDGDFALFLINHENHEIILARDRIGKKPLYWYEDHNHFIFGSEVKALLATGIVPQTPALDAMSSYLYFGYIPQDQSPIQNVNKILPAHYLYYRKNKGRLINSYWSYSSYFEKKSKNTLSTNIHHLDEMLRTSTLQLIPREDPFGCFITGGLGSASIAYYANLIAQPQRISSFTSGFKGLNDEDIHSATEISRALKIPQIKKLVTPDNFLNDFVKIIWYLDEPQADSNVIATWQMIQAAKERVDSVFSGMGSDELLAGHNRYTLGERKNQRFNALVEWMIPTLTNTLLPIVKTFYKPGAFALLKQARTNPWQFEYLTHNAIFDSHALAQAAPKLAKFFDPEIFLHKFYNINRIDSNIGAFRYFDVKTRLPDRYILQYERLTSALNLKWETPFLNREIIEFLAGVPEPSILVEDQTALFLKTILEPVFSKKILNRPKKSRRDFLMPWLNQSQLEILFKKLSKGRLVEAGLISEQWLLKHTKNRESQQEAFDHLWTLFSLEIWFRLYISQPIHSKPPNISVMDLLNS